MIVVGIIRYTRSVIVETSGANIILFRREVGRAIACNHQMIEVIILQAFIFCVFFRKLRNEIFGERIETFAFRYDRAKQTSAS